jgi:hypothetical protein
VASFAHLLLYAHTDSGGRAHALSHRAGIITGMAILNRWRWRITDPSSGRRSTTRYRMTEADALATDPAAERVPGSLEVLTVPDDPLALSAASLQAGPGR